MHRQSHERFERDFGGKVFFVFSKKIGDRKKIHNEEVVMHIQAEIERLQVI